MGRSFRLSFFAGAAMFLCSASLLLAEPVDSKSPQIAQSTHPSAQDGSKQSKEEPERKSDIIKEPSGAESKSASEAQTQPSVSTAENESFSASSVEITEPSGANISTSLIERINAALKSDPNLKSARDVKVTTENGKIILRGTVRSETEKQAVEQKIKDFAVENQIQVRPAEGQQPGTPQPQQTDQQNSPQQK